MITLLQDLINGLRAARRQRQLIERCRKTDAALNRIKGPVIRVGNLIHLPDGQVALQNWEFQPVPGMWVYRYDMDGNFRVCGYTTPELIEIHARRTEWV